MSPEWVTAIASFATFVVIAATAIAALVQLRHMRNSNQIEVLTEFRHTMDSPEFRDAFHFIRYELPGLMNDSEGRRILMVLDSPESQRVNLVANYLDYACSFVKHGVVNRDLACDLWYSTVVRSWDGLAPLIASRRAMLGYRLWEDFEYLALLCKRFRQKFPAGTYPQGEEPLPLPDPWPEAKHKPA